MAARGTVVFLTSTRIDCDTLEPGTDDKSAGNRPRVSAGPTGIEPRGVRFLDLSSNPDPNADIVYAISVKSTTAVLA